MTNQIIIQKTTNSPYVLLDLKKNLIEIKGPSFLEDSNGFFIPILQWINEYAETAGDTVVNMELTYFNSASAKILLTIFKILSAIQKRNSVLTVNWNYTDDDEDIRDSGKDFSKLSGIKFNMIEKETPESDYLI